VLFLVLLFASISDIKIRVVPQYVHLIIIGLALIRIAYILITHQNTTQLIDMGVGLVAILAIMIAGLLLSHNRLGGADIKLMAVCGLLLGVTITLTGIFLGAVLSVVINVAYDSITKKSFQSSFPLIPYLSMGVIIATVGFFKII
jgi:leader peptidase (prepilin peptidase)/N-methyltransferase